MSKWRENILKSKKVQAGVEKKAEKIQDYWRGLAPVFSSDKAKEHRDYPSHGAPGDYRKSITIKDLPYGDAGGKRIVDTDFKAHWIEFGSAHMPKYAPAAKTWAKFKK